MIRRSVQALAYLPKSIPMDLDGNNYTKIGVVLTATVGAGSSEVSSLRFVVADQAALARRARAAAMDDAKQRAEEYAKRAGIALGKVVRISEAGSTGWSTFQTGHFCWGGGE